jgi:hypothetical protein
LCSAVNNNLPIQLFLTKTLFTNLLRKDKMNAYVGERDAGKYNF